MLRHKLRSRCTGIHNAGFTLVELLVALMVTSLVSVMAYAAFDGILTMEERSKSEFLRENRLQIATSIIVNDLLHMRARPIRDQLGGQDYAYISPSGDYAVEFSRGGLPHFETIPGGVQRLAYDVVDEKLVRTVWRVMDRSSTTDRFDHILTDGVSMITFEQLTGENQFTGNWPPINSPVALDALPSMVLVKLEQVSGETIEIKVPGPGMGAISDKRALRMRAK